ncbi:MAG: PilZ domain-containing protein, partial [Planctomycetes bacterium]|nr:PilZ domain-containing protein [Planctomycetota bacterium]
MSSKTNAFKILEDLSLKELQDTQNYITNLIAKSRKPDATPPDTSVDDTSEHERQERFYTIFSCKFKRLAEQAKPAFSGIVVDVSKDGLRLKTTKKMEMGTILVTYDAQELPENDSLSAVVAENDALQRRACLEVVRLKEVGGIYEIGCELVRDHDAALDGLT